MPFPITVPVIASIQGSSCSAPGRGTHLEVIGHKLGQDLYLIWPPLPLIPVKWPARL